MCSKKLVIAIDGPAGAGKSTIAKIVAEQLGYAYIDTGAMYRSVTWKFLQTKEIFDEEFISLLSEAMVIEFKPEAKVNRVFVDGIEVTDAIRSPEVTKNVSKIAAIGSVRIAMVEQQRRMGENGGVLMDGRDIGTVVFPNADIKLFLTASVDERARRRYKELVEKGLDVNLDELKAEISLRDKQDSERKISPLRKAEDAMLLDTSDMTIAEVADYIIKLVQEKEHDLRNM